jgi:hypothetical protein
MWGLISHTRGRICDHPQRNGSDMGGKLFVGSAQVLDPAVATPQHEAAGSPILASSRPSVLDMTRAVPLSDTSNLLASRHIDVSAIFVTMFEGRGVAARVSRVFIATPLRRCRQMRALRKYPNYRL